MSKTETNVSTLKINRGTYANIQANLSNIGENELIITSDKNVPVPTARDVGKAPIINASGEYEFGSVGTDVVANPTLAGTEANLTSIKIAGTNYNVPDTTYTSKSAVSGGTDVSLVTTGEKYTWNNKQDALPSVVNDRYLHTNASTGALEWAEVQSGSIYSISLTGSSGTITTDVSTIANHLVNDKQIQIITQDAPIATITLMADRTSVAHPEDNDYTVVIFSSMDNGAKPEFIQWTFEFDLTDATPTITWEKTFSVKIPVSDSSDAGKVIGVNNNGNYALVQPSTPNAFHIDVTSQGMSGTITTDVANVASHMKNDDLLWINGFVCSLASRMVVSDEYFMAIYTADYYDATDFGQVSFYFVCTAYASGITFTETITKIPLPTTNDSGKVISVDSNGRFVLTQQSSNVPTPTSSDVNKILTVNAQGEYVLDSITNLADVYNGQVV